MTIDWGGALSKTHFDADTDDPSQARAELEAMVDRLNAKLANVTLIQVSDLSNGGVDGTVAETSGGGFPNVNADVTATDEELNKLDGVTATTAELNIVDGGVDYADMNFSNDISQGDIAANAVGRSEISTATASTSGVVSGSSRVDLALNNYALWPDLKQQSGSTDIILTPQATGTSSPNAANPGFSLSNTSASNRNYAVAHRYIS